MSGQIEFPEILEPLFEPRRFKVLYGGRAGAKSWGIARALLILGAQKKLRILCTREFQSSMRDSVHKLLSDQVDSMGLSDFYEVQQVAITGANGTEFIFAGLKHNINNLKSYEGCDIVWVEEAQSVSRYSWDKLIPTIRKSGSEIWISFNPELEDDYTYQRFVVWPQSLVGLTDENSVKELNKYWVQKVSYKDNPWISDESLADMEADRLRDYDHYLWTWEGFCKQTLDGAIYANELRKATEENRITSVPYDASKPVSTFWDLGRADKTAIWFVQLVGFEFRVIDFYDNNGHALPHYLKELQSRPYVYGECWLPHDARNELLASERTIEQQMRAAGFSVRITPKVSIANGINAARSVFDRCWFDSAKCSDGIKALRHYQYDVDPDTKQFSNNPMHNWASHAADAFRYMAVAMCEKKKDVQVNVIPVVHHWR